MAVTLRIPTPPIDKIHDKAGDVAGKAAHTLEAWASSPTTWPQQSDILDWSQSMQPGVAALLLLAGIVYLLYGYYIFRILITINAMILGAWIGAYIGAKNNMTLAAAAIGGFTLGALAWPMMRFAVAMVGGIVGALVGASAWRTFNLDPNFAWSGAGMGAIFFSMLSFILFRSSIILYTVLQGSLMTLVGILALATKHQQVGDAVKDYMTKQPMILPIAVFVPALLGWVYQTTKHKAPPTAAPAKK